MCGRYVCRSDKQRIAEYFHASPQPAELPLPGEDYNVAPTTFQPIIRQNRESGEREMVLARWGLIPFFTKELSDIKGLSTINARAESITKAPTWREPMKKRRCIVPASSFYEWEKAGKPPKTPYSFELANGNPIGFAGLWDAWKNKQGHWLQSFAIVTTEANELMSRVHPRMPVILHPRDYDRWLDREETEQLPLDLLRPLDPDEMRCSKLTQWSGMSATSPHSRTAEEALGCQEESRPGAGFGRRCEKRGDPKKKAAGKKSTAPACRPAVKKSSNPVKTSAAAKPPRK